MSKSENHVQRNVGPNKIHEKPKDFKKSIQKLLKYDKKLTVFYIIASILAIASSICSIIGPNGLSDLTDTITEGLSSQIDIESVKSIGVFLVTLYMCSAIFNLLNGFIMTTSANKMAKKLRTDISQKINKLPLRYFDKHSYGDILSRVTNDVDTIGMTVSRSLGTFFSAIALFISSIVMMFYTNWIMALSAIFSSILGLCFLFLENHKNILTQDK